MKPLITLVLASLAAGCMAADEPAELSARAQGELDQALAGRTAGPAQSCIPQLGLRSTRTIGEGAMVFEGPGDVRYVNRPPGGCPSLRFGRAFRTTTSVSQLCRGDIVTVFDPVSGAEFAGCSLGDFVPYRRPS